MHLGVEARCPHLAQRIRNAELMRRAEDEDLHVKVTVLHGSSDLGKSTWVNRQFPCGKLFVLTVGDGSPDSVWWDGYHGQEAVLIDEFEGQTDIFFSTNKKILLSVVEP